MLVESGSEDMTKRVIMPVSCRVGELIIRCGILGLSLELLDLGKWMQGEKAPPSGEAFAKTKEYRSSRHSHTELDSSVAVKKAGFRLAALKSSATEGSPF